MSLFSALSVSASGMSAQRTRAEIITENLANAETTRTPDGGPYRRKDVVFESNNAPSFASIFGDAMAPGGVSVSSISVDDKDPVQRYQPGHPDAGPDGYVSYPRISPAEEMVDLMSASRGYQANIASMTAVKDMIQHSLDLLR
ncbi:MAG TPA: flagellar basal body rod protein FlgC [Bryobacteraceae bacterium]|jgi:flagellar basal-body rod protein FlgC|nr:flagellar basal body rod protein FlgC [Bryobacteraceae bacterium]